MARMFLTVSFLVAQLSAYAGSGFQVVGFAQDLHEDREFILGDFLYLMPRGYRKAETDFSSSEPSK